MRPLATRCDPPTSATPDSPLTMSIPICSSSPSRLSA